MSFALVLQPGMPILLMMCKVKSHCYGFVKELGVLLRLEAGPNAYRQRVLNDKASKTMMHHDSSCQTTANKIRRHCREEAMYAYPKCRVGSESEQVSQTSCITDEATSRRNNENGHREA